MIQPSDAFRDLLLSLTQLDIMARVVPDAFACTLTPHPATDPWLISLVIQSHPLGLRVGGHLPLHLDPHEADIEGLLRRCNDLNRHPLPYTFSVDPLGLVAAFRCWLPLPTHSVPQLVGYGLELAEAAAHAGSTHLLTENEGFLQASAPATSLIDAVRGDDIPF